MTTYLTKAEDVRWLREVHCRAMPAGIRVALMHGHHEAEPTKVEAWKKSRPRYDDPPDYVWYEPTPDSDREPMSEFQSGER